jgi:hypothetical protein
MLTVLLRVYASSAGACTLQIGGLTESVPKYIHQASLKKLTLQCITCYALSSHGDPTGTNVACADLKLSGVQ